MRWIKEAARDNVVYTEHYKIPEENFQPASIDLQLGVKAHRLRCSFLPDESMELEQLPDLEMEELDLLPLQQHLEAVLVLLLISIILIHILLYQNGLPYIQS